LIPVPFSHSCLGILHLDQSAVLAACTLQDLSQTSTRAGSKVILLCMHTCAFILRFGNQSIAAVTLTKAIKLRRYLVCFHKGSDPQWWLILCSNNLFAWAEPPECVCLAHHVVSILWQKPREGERIELQFTEGNSITLLYEAIPSYLQFQMTDVGQPSSRAKCGYKPCLLDHCHQTMLF
jgi:hypothetical protein